MYIYSADGHKKALFFQPCALTFGADLGSHKLFYLVSGIFARCLGVAALNIVDNTLKIFHIGTFAVNAFAFHFYLFSVRTVHYDLFRLFRQIPVRNIERKTVFLGKSFIIH